MSKHKGTLEKAWYFFIGNLMYAIALDQFLVGNNIIGGGFAGIATVINYFVPIPVGTFVFILTLPFLFLSVKMKGKAYTIKTLVATFIYALFVDVLAQFPLLTTNKLVASVFGGLLYGLGAVAFLKAQASAGGTDLVARLLHQRFKTISLGKVFLTVDGAIVVLAMVVFKDFETGLYALITMYICAAVCDKIINGFDYANICYIISEHHTDAIAEALMSRMLRGVTCMKGQGMYSGVERRMLWVVVRPKETFLLKDIVSDIDDTAFVVVAHANEVLGDGFKLLKEKK